MLARYGIVLAALAALILLIWGFATGVGQSPVSAQRFVNLQEGNNPHASFRRAHAKGFCIAGDFASNGNLAEHSQANVFESGEHSFVGRISIAGNNPTAPDMRAPVRSMALSFGEGSDTWRIAMNTPPVMPVGTPEAFFEQITALSPDPETGQRNPEKIQQFFASHPETQAFREWQASYTPTQSFATETYHSINAFYLVNTENEKQAVRWAVRPSTRTSSEPFIELKADNPDALQNEMRARLEEGPVVFDVVFTLATDEDDENNPTVPWPDEREQVLAGQLNVVSMQNQQGGLCNEINFDPLVLPTGMAATDDPILRARSAAYAESYRRRARETFLGQGEESSYE